MASHPAAGLSRRQFLQAAPPASGWPCRRCSPPTTRRPTRSAASPSACRATRFRNFDLEQALKRIQDLGLQYVEFYQKHVPARPARRSRSRRS